MKLWAPKTDSRLFELADVAAGGPERLTGGDIHADAAAERALEQLERAADHGVEVDLRDVERLTAPERQQLPGRDGGAPSGVADDAQRVLPGGLNDGVSVSLCDGHR